ncbi:hypothetical protein SAMN04488688_105364 [Paenibacillus sp. cl141a]|nr:hypothetical protein [Paenibacillus sp. cl141a]SEL74699.1 hypothetical protein SAMN04488688_105364 [Paenibacillus sp. cl141a]
MIIDEAIHLEPYDKQWADQYNDEHRLLIGEIGPYTVRSNISEARPYRG